MNRVLVTGGAGGIGAAVVRRLLADPDFEVRVGDLRAAPQWMREGCEVRTGDLRDPDRARAATTGCTHVVHLAAPARDAPPHTLLEGTLALDGNVLGAALDVGVERFVHVACPLVVDLPAAGDAWGFARLTGEVRVRAAAAEHGLPATVCRPFDVVGPGVPAAEVAALVQRCLALPAGAPLPIAGDGTPTRTPTHVDDVADGIVTAMASPAGLRQDLDLAAGEALTVAELARIVWEACGRDAGAFALVHLPASSGDAERRRPRVEEAERLLGWRARTGARDGVAQTVTWLRAHGAAP